MITENMRTKFQELISSEYKMMLHLTDAMSIFQEAGFHGFKRVMEYFAYDRQSDIIRLRKILGDISHCYPKTAIAFQGYTGSGITSMMQETHDAISNHISILQECASLCVENGEHRIMGFLEERIKDETDIHRIKLYRIIEAIQNAKSDPAYVMELDRIMHCKYKAKLEALKYKDWKKEGE